MKVWIPTKDEIEQLIYEAYLVVKAASTITEVKDKLTDELSLIGCHIANRALMERKEN